MTSRISQGEGGARFTPTHRIKRELSTGSTVDVQTDGDRFGLIFVNTDGEETRLLLSSEAMSAVANSYAQLVNGCGDQIAYRWRVCVEHVVQAIAKSGDAR